MQIQQFAEIEQEFLERVFKIVWCNVATVDTHNRPRSRVLHPIWEGAVGWIATGRNTLKTKHLAHNPHLSLAYIADPLNPIYVDCIAAWVADDDFNEKLRIWELFRNTQPPMGYDPTPFFGSPRHESFGVLKLTPWRIELYALGGESKIWHS